MTYPRNLPNLNLLELGKPPPCRPSSKARNNPNYNSWVKKRPKGISHLPVCKISAQLYSKSQGWKCST